MVYKVHIASAGTAGYGPAFSSSEKQRLQARVQKDVRHLSLQHFLFNIFFYDALKFSVCFYNFLQRPKVTQSHFVKVIEVRQTRS